MGLSAVNVNNSMGANGSAYVNDTAAHTNGTDGWTAIQFTEDSVLAALVGKMDDSADLISGRSHLRRRASFVCPLHIGFLGIGSLHLI